MPVSTLIADPEFQKLSIAQQREALSRFDPEFGKLNDSQIGEFKSKISNGGQTYNLFNPDLPGVTNMVPPDKRISNLSDVAREVLRGVRPYADATATGLGFGTTGPLGGVLAGTGTHLAIQKAMEGLGEPQQSIPESLYNAGETNSINELGGLISSGLYSKIKGMFNPYESISPTAQRLGPVYDKMIQEGGGPSYSQQNPGSVKKAIEDIFGGDTKTQQLKSAAAAGTKVGAKLAGDISGSGISAFEDPFDVVKKFGGDLERTKDAYLGASNQAAEVSKNVASLNPAKVLAGYKTTPAGAGFIGSPAIKTPIFKDVNGPVVLGSSSQIANDFLKTQEELYGAKSTAELFNLVEDRKKPLIAAAKRVADYGMTPIPFEAAWELKQAAGEHGGFDNIVKSFKEAKFTNLTSAIDDDIEKSIGSWKNSPQVALKAYQEAKTLVSNRHDLFQQDDAIKSILGVKPGNSAKPEFDKILNDPLLTGKAIAASGPGGRSNLQSYQIQKVLQDNFDSATETYNRKGLLDAWNDPNKQAVYKKLYSSDQRADIGNFIEALSNVSQNRSNLGKYATAIRVAGAGVNIAGSILTGTLQAHHIATPATIIGADIALSSFTKNVLLNPKIARAATILMSQSPSSSEARFLGRQVIGALNGVRLVLTTQDGKKVPGEVEDGKIIPIGQ